MSTRAKEEVKTHITKKRVSTKAAKSGRARAVTGDVAETQNFEGIWMSIHQFCRETRKDRDMVARRISHAGTIRPVTGPKGQPLYRLANLIDVTYVLDEAGDINIDKMDPFRKKAHYDSELGKLKLATQSGDLMPRTTVEQRFASIFQIVSRFCDTLPDVLERDSGLNVTQIKLVEQKLDATRLELHKAINDMSDQQEKETP